MLHQLTTPAVLLLVLAGTCDNPVVAQSRYQNPATAGRPTISPYLNLFREGNAAVNYYGIVRPQQDFQRQQSALGREIRSLQNAPGGAREMRAANSNLNTTGHVGEFLVDPSSVQTYRSRLIERDRLAESVEGRSRIGTTGHVSGFGISSRYYRPNELRTSIGR